MSTKLELQGPAIATRLQAVVCLVGGDARDIGKGYIMFFFSYEAITASSESIRVLILRMRDKRMHNLLPARLKPNGNFRGKRE